MIVYPIDGTISKRGHISYTSSSKKLAIDVKILAESLGCICRMVPRTTYCEGKSHESFRVHIRTNTPDIVFSLQRKLNRVKRRKKTPIRRKM